MKTRHLFALALVAVVVCSCIPSVNPFYSEKDLVFETALLGEWQTKGASDEPHGWNFEKAGFNEYKLTVAEKDNKTGEFRAHLFKLQDKYFLDLIPSECNYATNQADLVSASMFAGHLLARVPQLGPELKLAFCDFDWLEKYLKANPQALAHHVEDQSILLTANTAELQKFVLAHLGTNELFGDAGELVRVTNSVPSASGRK